MSLFKNVNVVSYIVRDWERAKKFYTDVLGWPVVYLDDTIGWMEFGRDNEAHVAISRARDASPVQQGTVTLVLTVDDAHAATKELRARGIKCDDVVTIPGAVTFGGFYDPDGNRIQFASSQPPA